MSNHMDNILDEELRILERQLSNLTPSPIPSDTFSRMQGLVASDVDYSQGTELTGDGYCTESDLNELELHLDMMKPASMPDDMLVRMTAAMDRWQDRSESNVVSFDGESSKSQGQRRPVSSFGNMWAAAAAVALLGAVTALTLPRMDHSETVVAAGNHSDASGSIEGVSSPSQPIAQANTWTTSDSLSHKVTRTSDTGVVMAGDNKPHRCIRVDYINRIKAKDADGREIEIKSPGVDYVLIPVETN